MTGLWDGAATAIGRVRRVNEDSYLASPPVYAVADGMGGHGSGEWTAVTGDGCWALINAAPDSVTVREIWQRIEDGASLDTLMASLLRTGLRDAPDFALLATHDGSKHLFCRGRGVATVNSGGTSERLAGTGLATWREHPVAPDAGSVVLGDSSAGTYLHSRALKGIR
jgi:hypothetical protein